MTALDHVGEIWVGCVARVKLNEAGGALVLEQFGDGEVGGNGRRRDWIENPVGAFGEQFGRTVFVAEGARRNQPDDARREDEFVKLDGVEHRAERFTLTRRRDDFVDARRSRRPGGGLYGVGVMNAPQRFGGGLKLVT